MTGWVPACAGTNGGNFDRTETCVRRRSVEHPVADLVDDLAGLRHREGDGIVVGRLNGRLLRLRGQQFVILAAPTRSGKGVGIVIPNLLDYRESAVVLDIKQENFDLTSGWRQSIGHDVYLFNPFAEDHRTHRWNPMTYVSPDPAFRVSDLQSIAAMLYPDGDDKDKFWVSQARNAFLAFALYLFERHEHDRLCFRHEADLLREPGVERGRVADVGPAAARARR